MGHCLVGKDWIFKQLSQPLQKQGPGKEGGDTYIPFLRKGVATWVENYIHSRKDIFKGKNRIFLFLSLLFKKPVMFNPVPALV